MSMRPANWCCRTCGWSSSIARGYLGYGLPHADLIQEGNVGLMKAVRRFDPERGVRLVSFACIGSAPRSTSSSCATGAS